MGHNPFDILDNQPRNMGEAVHEENKSGTMSERISRLISSSPIFLFMKGAPEMPQCGFSANVVAILNSYGKSFKSFDILSDMDIRQGVKEYANWPTYPQLWFKGQLVGGSDIITEMHQNGELKTLLG
jgi:monothiol glutaredoxin